MPTVATETTESSPVQWIESGGGVVTLLLDDPTQKVNTLSTELVAALVAAVDRLEAEQDRINGVILRSAKSSFLAGGDLNRLLAVTDADREAFADDLNFRKSTYRRLELFPHPVVAVIDGPAMGGGLELALCCHRRIGAGRERTVVGLPEVGLGLIPGAGGIVRCVRRMGVRRALDDILLHGAPLDLDRAQEIGLIDEIADTTDDAIAAAERWIASSPAELSRTPETVEIDPDCRDLRVPPQAVRAREALVDVAVWSTGLALDDALRYETDALANLIVDVRSKNIIRTRFFGTAQLNRRIDKTVAIDGPVSIVAGQVASELLRSRLTFVAQIDDAGVRDDVSCPQEFIIMGEGPERSLRGRVCPDALGDQMPVVEVEDDGNALSRSVQASLKNAGCVVIPLSAGSALLSERLRTTLSTRVRQLRNEGRSDEEVRSAIHWSGMSALAEGLSLHGETSDYEPASMELVRSLLDSVADAALQAADTLLHPEDIDPATVRLGMPGWTGGAQTWSLGDDLR